MKGCQILHNAENELQTRSVVGYHNGGFLVGTPAMRRWPLAPKETIISIKRLMGRAVSDPEVTKVKGRYLYEIVEPSDGTQDSVRVKLGGKELSPIDVSAKILSKLKADAEKVLGEPVTHAVITVPAYFSDKQRHATRTAGQLAGLQVMKILDEPTAAAIAYGLTTTDTEARTILVYDLGGGTFDVSVLMKAAGTFAQLNLEGDMWLGGDDFDNVLVEEVCTQIMSAHGVDPKASPAFMAVLKTEAQKAKEALSSSDSADILITGQLKDKRGQFINVEAEITRARFEELIRPLVDRSLELVRKAVANANLTIAEIDHVLLAGNATAVPLVQRALEGVFGKEKILRSIHPKHAVAIGAAIAGASLKGPECPKCLHVNDFAATVCERCQTELANEVRTRRCSSCGQESDLEAEVCAHCQLPFLNVASIKGGIAPFSYGIQTAGDKFHVFINKGDGFPTIPDRILVQTFYTSRPNQRMIAIPVYGGDRYEAASRNDKQGDVLAVLPADCPEGTPIKLKLFLDRDGAFLVQAFLENGTSLHPLILRGETDQKAVNLFIRAEEELARKKLALKPDDLGQVEEYREKALLAIAGKDFDAAVRASRDYLNLVENVEKGGDPVLMKAEAVLSWSEFVASHYDWLISDDHLRRLHTMCQELKAALARRDLPEIKRLSEQLDILGDQLCEVRKGKERDLTLLGLFMGLRNIIWRISQKDLTASDQLKTELARVEEAVRTDPRHSHDLFNRFVDQVLAARDRILGAGLRCHACGASNPPDVARCTSCGASLLVLSADRRSIPSKF
jgi:molecular chaperone DnaK (HSP70)